MKQFLPIVFLLLCVQAFGQSYYKVYQRSTWKATLTYPDYKAIVPLKPVKAGVEPENDKFYYWFSGNKIKVTQGSFSGKLLNGNYMEYYSSGNLKEQGEFKKGLKTGEWKSWTSSGVLAEKISWKRGGKNGTYSKYDSTGRLIEKGRLQNNILEGKLSKYSGKDSVTVMRYHDGSVVSKETHGYIKFIKKRLTFKKDSVNKEGAKKRIKGKKTEKKKTD